MFSVRAFLIKAKCRSHMYQMSSESPCSCLQVQFEIIKQRANRQDVQLKGCGTLLEIYLVSNKQNVSTVKSLATEQIHGWRGTSRQSLPSASIHLIKSSGKNNKKKTRVESTAHVQRLNHTQRRFHIGLHCLAWVRDEPECRCVCKQAGIRKNFRSWNSSSAIVSFFFLKRVSLKHGLSFSLVKKLIPEINSKYCNRTASRKAPSEVTVKWLAVQQAGWM